MKLGDYKSINATSAYQGAFGAFQNETCYSDPYGFKGFQVDERKGTLGKAVSKAVQNMKNAFTTNLGGAGSTDRVMIPIYVDNRIVDITKKFTPLVEFIPRVTNQGLTADFNVVTGKNGAFVAGEDESLESEEDDVERRSYRIKYLYAVGRVTGPTQAAVPNFMLEAFEPTGGAFYGDTWQDQSASNANQMQVLFRARKLKEFEEDLIINGDTDNDPREFDGIVKQQGSTNEVDKEGAEVELSDIESAVQKAFDNGGRPSIAIGSSGAVSQLRNKMQEKFYFQANMETLDYGVPAGLTLHTMVGRVPLFPSMFLDNTEDNKSIYFLDMGFVEMRVLLDMTYQTLAKANDSDKFMLKIYECLVLRAPEFNASIRNID